MESNWIPENVLNIIQRNKVVLCERIKPSVLFLATLQAKDVLTNVEIKHVEIIKLDFDRNYSILNFIEKGTRTQLKDFKDALISTNQSCVVEYLGESNERSQQANNTVTWTEHEKWIFDYFEIDKETIEFLGKENYNSFESIISGQELLTIVLKRSPLNLGQIGKVNTLIEELKLPGDGISDEHREILEIKKLTLLIKEPTQIIVDLLFKKALTGNDYTKLTSYDTDEEKINALFHLLQIKADNCFNIFLDTLKTTNQGYLANLIEGGRIGVFKTGMSIHQIVSKFVQL